MDRSFAFRQLRGRLVRFAALSVCGLLSFAGCANFSLPQIDPTGQRIFTGNNTPVTSCLFPTPTPAFQPAPELPYCADPNAPMVATATTPAASRSSHHVDPRSNQTVLLDPAQVVAPVGTEVVLKAGLCGADGRLASRERLEWILEPTSVGHFVEVGDDACDVFDFFSSERRSRKVDADYALGRTTGAQDVLTRGTPNVADDISLKNGEGWVSVSSPIEGVSRVTVLAPESEQMGQRQQTASVYWVDAAWTFPAPGGSSAGQPFPLTTALRRATTGTPLAGWIVRYEVVGGAPAGFGPQRQQGAQVISDANGMATAELVPADATSGATQVLVSIVRPPSPDGSVAEISVAQAVTTVSWSAPNLTIGVTGPAEVQAGAPFDMNVTVGNPGDVAARGVSLAYAIPAGVEIVSTEPASRPFGERVEWALGDVPAGGAQTIRVSARATAGGELRSCFVATSQDGLRAEQCLATRVQVQALQVRVTAPPDSVPVGGQATFQISVTNVSGAPVQNVELIDQYGPGLRNEQGSPLRAQFGTLEPLATKQIPLTFTVLAEGEQCHEVQVSGAGGQFASARSCVVGVPAPIQVAPRMAIDGAGPATARVGENADYTFAVYNTGGVALTDVRIVVTVEPSLSPIEASAGQQRLESGAGYYWIIPRIEPGANAAVRLLSRCVSVDPDARQSVEVTTREGLTDRRPFVTVISPAAAAAPPASTLPLQPQTGRLLPAAIQGSAIAATFTDQSDPIRVGEVQTYLLTLRNEGSVDEEDVVVRIEFPPGLRYERTPSSPVQPAAVGANGIEYTPFRMPAGDSPPPFRIQATGVTSGMHEARVTVFTRTDRAGKVFTETTTVSP
ncbi:MAG TPA: hypothetical protein VGN57_14690 [Pirellulaceae bacterium]|jgi:uncharacterized repeat protein (TIGR01451 family)|nr:hypothetical protein [Pirellulaceae bacterium]